MKQVLLCPATLPTSELFPLILQGLPALGWPAPSSSIPSLGAASQAAELELTSLNVPGLCSQDPALC